MRPRIVEEANERGSVSSKGHSVVHTVDRGCKGGKNGWHLFGERHEDQNSRISSENWVGQNAVNGD